MGTIHSTECSDGRSASGLGQAHKVSSANWLAPHAWRRLAPATTSDEMLADNEANQANFDEVQSHLDAISAKLTTAAGEQRTRLLEDQEAHYENALRLRRMASETYMIERNEARASCDTARHLYQRAYWQRAVLICACFVFALVAITELTRPGASRAAVVGAPVYSIASYCGAVLAGAIAALRAPARART